MQFDIIYLVIHEAIQLQFVHYLLFINMLNYFDLHDLLELSYDPSFPHKNKKDLCEPGKIHSYTQLFLSGLFLFRINFTRHGARFSLSSTIAKNQRAHYCWDISRLNGRIFA